MFFGMYGVVERMEARLAGGTCGWIMMSRIPIFRKRCLTSHLDR